MSVQLRLERAARALIALYEIFPEDFPIYCAHEVLTRDADTPDFLDLIAEHPRYDGGAWEVSLRMELFSAVADASQRQEQSDLHILRVHALRNLWSRENFAAVFTALDGDGEGIAGEVYGDSQKIPLGFSGWYELPDESAEGSIAGNDSQVGARLHYKFFVHILS